MHELDAEIKTFAGNPRSEEAVVEIPVLLESPLMKALESAARTRETTAGALVRSLLRDFLCYSESDESVRMSERETKKASPC